MRINLLRVWGIVYAVLSGILNMAYAYNPNQNISIAIVATILANTVNSFSLYTEAT